MAFLTILIVLILQRLIYAVHKKTMPHWLLNGLFKRLQYIKKNPLLKKSVYAQVLGVLVPLPLILGILSFFLSRTNVFITFCFDLIVLWYCLGDSRFQQSKETHQSVGTFFMSAYAEVFAIIFWFILFGAAGAALYYSTNGLIKYLDQQKMKVTNQIEAILKIRAVLDWIPVRLLGLTFALAGHFFITAADWLKHLAGGLKMNHHLIAEYGKKAINFKTEDLKYPKEQALFLIKRTLWLWLIGLSIISLALWIG